MAGDWLKVRTNLWDDPRVSRLCDLTEQREATIIGALYWLWATADQHSAHGDLPGLTLRQIDRKTGVEGFGEAMCKIGWLSVSADGVRIARFDEHNGSSAKRRAQDAQRKASDRSLSASNADKRVANAGQGGDRTRRTAELEREKEKRKGETHTEPTPPAPPPPCPLGTSGDEVPSVCGTESFEPASVAVLEALRVEGIEDCSPADPELRRLVCEGVPVEEFRHAARMAKSKAKGTAYALGIIRQRLRDAANENIGGSPPPVPSKARSKTVPDRWWCSSGGVSARAEQLGLQQSEGEDWVTFTARVWLAAGDGPWLRQEDATTHRIYEALKARLEKGAAA